MQRPVGTEEYRDPFYSHVPDVLSAVEVLVTEFSVPPPLEAIYQQHFQRHHRAVTFDMRIAPDLVNLDVMAKLLNALAAGASAAMS